MIRLVATLAAAALTAAAPAPERTAIMHATGSFVVRITPEAQGAAPESGLPTARMAIAKTFSGGLVGQASGTMLSAGTPAPGHAAGYVAVDQFHGTLDGRRGGFLLLHRGTMTDTGKSDLSVVISPGTGTGALAGIEGFLSIEVREGQHLYDLTYTLPAAT